MKPSIFSLEVQSHNNCGIHMFPRLSRLCQGSLSVFISTQFIPVQRCRCRLNSTQCTHAEQQQHVSESKKTKPVQSAVHMHTSSPYQSANGLLTLSDYLRCIKKPPGTKSLSTDGKYIYTTRVRDMWLLVTDIPQMTPFNSNI